MNVCLDINEPIKVNIKISYEGDRLWVCTDKHNTVLRIKGITELTIEDDGEPLKRPDERKTYEKDQLEAPPFG